MLKDLQFNYQHFHRNLCQHNILLIFLPFWGRVEPVNNMKIVRITSCLLPLIAALAV
jgi:hypothetical protein